MTVDITWVWTDKNQIVYLLATSGSPLGGTASILSAGGVTPDLVTDGANNTKGEANGTALRKVVRSGLDGQGLVAAGAWTQAQARALLMLVEPGASIGGILLQRAKLRVIRRSGTAEWTIDCNVTAGNPRIDVGATAAAGEAVLYVELNHSLAP